MKFQKASWIYICCHYGGAGRTAFDILWGEYMRLPLPLTYAAVMAAASFPAIIDDFVINPPPSKAAPVSEQSLALGAG